MAEKKIRHSDLTATYLRLLDQQEFVEEELDYGIFEKHRPRLETLSAIGNSGVSVFDHFKREHIFYSPNFCSILGYDVDEIKSKGQQYLDDKIHKDDILVLIKNGILLLKLFYDFTSNEKRNFKLINEFRILNSEGKYIRVIEQHQVLELDNKENIWLSLSIIDVSPDQRIDEGVKSRLFNFVTGEMVPFSDESDRVVRDLTRREKEILKLVKEGLLSKEISDKLSISVHTVNTHRQRVLEKLGANNSIEAITLASGLGLLE